MTVCWPSDWPFAVAMAPVGAFVAFGLLGAGAAEPEAVGALAATALFTWLLRERLSPGDVLLPHESAKELSNP